METWAIDDEREVECKKRLQGCGERPTWRFADGQLECRRSLLVTLDAHSGTRVSSELDEWHIRSIVQRETHEARASPRQRPRQRERCGG